MRLTAYCIAKDEEAALPFMLDSVKDIADEIVVCDTGSTDSTIEIARKYTDKVYEIPWEDSFAKARNRALEYCTGDWILSMDCDETLDAESAKALRAELEQLPDHVDLAFVTIVMCMDDGRPYQEFLGERIFRGGRGIRFEGDMHNWINVPTDSNSRVALPHIRILHNRGVKGIEARSERAHQRLSMAEEIFIPKIEANPTDRRSMFYLGGTYFDSGMYDKAEEWLKRYLEVSDWPEERYQAALLLAQCYLNRNDKEAAGRILSLHLRDNWRRGEALVMLANMAREAGDLGQAEWWAKVASLKPMPVDPLFAEVAAHTWQPHFELWQTYMQGNDPAKAWESGQKAIELGAPDPIPILRYAKDNADYGNQKILCLVDRGQMDFIQPFIDSWIVQGKEVRIAQEIREEDIDWAEIVWCEWAGPLAVELTKLPKKQRIIIRIIGYEVNAGFIPQIEWQKVDDAIFLTDYLAVQAREQCPQLPQACNAYVVSGGVETDKFSIGKEKQGNKIAMLGYCNTRKNIPLALQLLAASPDNYELHIAGEWQDQELLTYVQHFAKETGLADRIRIYGRIEDRDEWFADKDFILSASIRETFHYALAEGMAAGLKPVIHDWKSARNFYDSKWIFRTVAEAVEMLKVPPDEAEQQGFRDYAEKWLNVSDSLERINRIVRKPKVAVAGNPSTPYAMEHKMARTLWEMGCNVDSLKPDVVMLHGHRPDIEPWMNGAYRMLWHGELVSGDSEKAIRSRELIADIVPQVDVVICGHEEWAPYYKEMGAKRVEVIPGAGAVGPWWPIRDSEKKYDVGFYGAITERRQKLLEELGKELNIFVNDSYNHVEHNQFVNECKIVLNIHAYDFAMSEHRIGEAMAAGACVVSEPLCPDTPYDKTCFIETDDLVGEIKRLLADDAERERIGLRAHEWVWRHHNLRQTMEKHLRIAGV